MTLSPYWSNGRAWLYHGSALEVLREIPDRTFRCAVTSPPYFGLRDYGVPGQLGAESSPAEYVEAMRAVFAEVRRVLADDGTLWVNLGDSYQSTGGTGVGPNARVGSTKRQAVGRTRPRSDLPAKNMLGIPWRVAFAMQEAGWVLRNDIIWRKTNPMPYSGKDRFASTYEHIFMLTKSQRYYFDLDAVRVEPKYGPGAPQLRGDQPRKEPDRPQSRSRQKRYAQGQSGAPAANGAQHLLGHPLGKNPGDVWDISTKPFSEAHFAVYPPELPERCVLAGSAPGDLVLDPFSGSGTTGMVALRHGRRYVGIELNAEYLDLSIRSRFKGGDA